MNRSCTCGAPLPRFAKKFCPKCRAERRVMQLRRAKRRFQRAKRRSHHIFYRGQLSSWAQQNPDKALRLWHKRNPGMAEAPVELVRCLCTIS